MAAKPTHLLLEKSLGSLLLVNNFININLITKINFIYCTCVESFFTQKPHTQRNI
jgi:hypothetical protein